MACQVSVKVGIKFVSFFAEVFTMMSYVVTASEFSGV